MLFVEYYSMNENIYFQFIVQTDITVPTLRPVQDLFKFCNMMFRVYDCVSVIYQISNKIIFEYDLKSHLTEGKVGMKAI